MNEITRPIEVITQEINFYKLQAGNAIIEIGKRLHEAKLTLPHGAWGAWLQNEVEFSERTAQNFMRIAKEYRNPQLIADMGNSATKALLLLSLPAEEREEFVGEAHEIDGEEKTVAAMTTKEMERLLKELEAERTEKEKLQSQLDLFRTEKDNAVDAAYKETEDKLDALVSQKEAAEQAKREAEEKIAAMESEMDELRMQAEQTALPDESELERIRREAENTANQKAEEAAQKEAEEAMLKAKEELAQVKADTEKKLKAAGSSGIVIFKVHFEAVQGEINKMLTCIDGVEESEGKEEADKLRKALKSLCQSVQDNL